MIADQPTKICSSLLLYLEGYPPKLGLGLFVERCAPQVNKHTKNKVHLAVIIPVVIRSIILIFTSSSNAHARITYTNPTWSSFNIVNPKEMIECSNLEIT